MRTCCSTQLLVSAESLSCGAPVHMGVLRMAIIERDLGAVLWLFVAAIQNSRTITYLVNPQV